jgi:hypothetical protein
MVTFADVNRCLHRFWPFVLLASMCAGRAAGAPGTVFQISVAAQPDEDLAAACQYEMTLTDPSRPVRGAWVIFDRGRDMLRYYGDPDVQAFAQRHDLALIVPFHCRAKADGDIDMDPSRGIGRALFAALTQFATVASHPELASTKLILLGFSGTGALVGRFPEFAPNRVLAVIATNAGHYHPLGVDTIALSARAAAIPQLIIAGSADAASGIERPYAYFRKYFDRGAPWTFLVQNNTPHCCVINAKALVLEWLEAVVIKQVRRDRDVGSYGFISTAASARDDCPKPRPALGPPGCHSTKDTWGGTNWLVAAADTRHDPNPPDAMMPSGWLPTRRFAKQWVSFIRQPEHPFTSLP